MLSDWFCSVEADSEESAQKVAAENYRQWLSEFPGRIVVWEDPAARPSETQEVKHER